MTQTPPHNGRPASPLPGLICLLTLPLLIASATLVRATPPAPPPAAPPATPPAAPPTTDPAAGLPANLPANIAPPSWLVEDAFVRAVAHMAIQERIRTGVPASITAAQAILESNWGRAPIAQRGNNYFGIKCKSYWTGRTVAHVDDDRDAAGQLTESCFRAYDNIEDSFRDHSDFLRASERYAQLFRHAITDYKSWAHGLRQCGYATDETYGEKLIGIIERLELYALDWEGHREDSWLLHSVGGAYVDERS